jgi:hypothetical protein
VTTPPDEGRPDETRYDDDRHEENQYGGSRRRETRNDGRREGNRYDDSRGRGTRDDDGPVLPQQTRDDDPREWGEERGGDSDDERILREVPPHH